MHVVQSLGRRSPKGSTAVTTIEAPTSNAPAVTSCPLWCAEVGDHPWMVEAGPGVVLGWHPFETVRITSMDPGVRRRCCVRAARTDGRGSEPAYVAAPLDPLREACQAYRHAEPSGDRNV